MVFCCATPENYGSPGMSVQQIAGPRGFSSVMPPPIWAFRLSCSQQQARQIDRSYQLPGVCMVCLRNAHGCNHTLHALQLCAFLNQTHVVPISTKRGCLSKQNQP